ncbi:conjugative transposon protein TraN [Flavobacterium sp. FlaQc-57]|uniref:conjugative transposon protein TraN n=1 Tax=Flavobacterium sp. FlaQc-57 TaxID=3374186 RepID=UPI0037584B00
MKNNKLGFLASLLVLAFSLSAQSNDGGTIFKNLQIGFSKTTSIVFPYPIISIDKGSQGVLIQKAKGVENILLVKAGLQNFTQTNLTVVTSDGKLYGFILNYDEQCPDLNLVVDNSTVVNKEVVFSMENQNQKKIEQYANLAFSKNKKIVGLSSARFDIKLQITGLFIHQDVIYLRLVIGNKSKINYDIDQLRFFIRDQKKSIRTASQEIEILPLLSTSEVSKIPDESEVLQVLALSKFTIPEKKYLTIQLIEKSGGRQIELNIKNNDLIDLEVLGTL